MRNTAALLTLVFTLVVLDSWSQTVNYSDSMITKAASDKYYANWFGRFFLGSHYRKVWLAPINVQYLDIDHMMGGLTPLKEGGGYQTKSLRLLDGDSIQYVIRTIDKDPSKTVDIIFRNTIVTDALKDQISASHPYGFLVIPPLAKAAGIYHTNPQLLYVPDDPKLGVFRNDFKYQMVLFEEREFTATDFEGGLSGFKKVGSTDEVYTDIHKSSDCRVDEKFVLRSRLFDMLIGDWDRHEGQWVWAQFNLEDGTKMFRPIPRDRDQAFFNFDGFLPTIASLNLEETRKMQKYKPMPRSIKWFNYNARYFDLNFLTQMSKADWLNAADTLMLLITDEEIQNAFHKWPDTVYKLSAPELIKTLKQRRNNLPRIAAEYYEFLSNYVNVVGTNNRDYFDIKRINPDSTDVTVYDYGDSVKGKIFYHRTFIANETKRIQVYGLEGNDVFSISGNASDGTLVRVIGGPGNDSITDKSEVGGLEKKLRYYDLKNEQNYMSLGNEGANKTSRDSMWNLYSTRNFEQNFNQIFPVFGYNVDDGVFLGASISIFTNGFKMGPCPDEGACYNVAPYVAKQSIGFDFAFKTGAFNFFYRGDFADVVGKLDLNIQANVQAPNSSLNFFGYGNESLKIYPDNYYRLRMNQILLFPALEAGGPDQVRFLFGPIYQHGAVLSDSSQTFVSGDTTVSFFEVFPALTPGDLVNKDYLGVNTQLIYDPFKQDTMPRFVVRFLVNTGFLKQVDDKTVYTAFTRGYVSLFYNFYNSKSKRPQLTVATRFGGGYNLGDYEFYQANMIGGRTNENVRGFRGERYNGRASLYNNLEVRLRLFHFNAYVMPAEFGIIGMIDNGRVWQDDETSNIVHTGYGGGIWLSPFSLGVISATWSWSDDEKNGLFYLKLGWWF